MPGRGGARPGDPAGRHDPEPRGGGPVSGAGAGRAVGRAVADVCNMLNPEAIVVGGDLSRAGDALLEGVRGAVDRIICTWSLIKMMPEQSFSGTRSSLTRLLLEHLDLTEDELVVVGLKHLHQTDAPKKQQQRDFGVDDTCKDNFSDEQVLECLAKAFANR